MHGMEMFGYLGALLTLATFSMKTMLRLRVVGIVSNLAFITYGVVGGVYPVLLLHMVLLPLNGWRLRQLMRLTRQIEHAAGGGLAVEWLKPFSRCRAARAGERLFRKGDAAGEVLFVLSGRFRALEADVALERGAVFGELGLVSEDQRRTQSVVCEQDGELLLISYDEVRQMYFQNPRFGFFFLELVAERLTRDSRNAARAMDSTARPAAGAA